jgi:hypothetical protein
VTIEGHVGPDPADEYRAWSVWVSGTGHWWAIYKAVLTSRQIASGCLPLVVADDRVALATRIREQEAIRAQYLQPPDSAR